MPNRDAASGAIEGFDERARGDRHEGAKQENYKIVRAKLRGRQVDQRCDADGKNTEDAEHGSSDSDELHHSGLDVQSLCKVVLLREERCTRNQSKKFGVDILKGCSTGGLDQLQLDEG